MNIQALALLCCASESALEKKRREERRGEEEKRGKERRGKERKGENERTDFILKGLRIGHAADIFLFMQLSLSHRISALVSEHIKNMKKDQLSFM